MPENEANRLPTLYRLLAMAWLCDSRPRRLPDADGIELPDWQAACLKAIQRAGTVLQDDAQSIAVGEDWRIDVIDSSGLILFRMKFLMIEAPVMLQADQAWSRDRALVTGSGPPIVHRPEQSLCRLLRVDLPLPGRTMHRQLTLRVRYGSRGSAFRRGLEAGDGERQRDDVRAD